MFVYYVRKPSPSESNQKRAMCDSEATRNKNVEFHPRSSGKFGNSI